MEIIIKTKDLKKKDINDFKNFQGELKHLGKEELNKLKNNILRNGFISPIFIWENNIIDGHQRITAVKELIKEGHKIKDNELPYVEIIASNKKEAAKYVLAYNSQFGEITKEGLISYKNDYDIDLENLKDEININLDIERVIDHDRITDMEDVEPEDPNNIKTDIKNGEIYGLGAYIVKDNKEMEVEVIE